MNTTDKILIIDLEASCWDGPVPEGQVNEIIEISACMLDTATGAISQRKGLLVQPERSAISAFCTQLTTTTQALLDREVWILKTPAISCVLTITPTNTPGPAMAPMI